MTWSSELFAWRDERRDEGDLEIEDKGVDVFWDSKEFLDLFNHAPALVYTFV
jgi:hypothetical protein